MSSHSGVLTDKMAGAAPAAALEASGGNLSLAALSALVIGSMIGGGIFSLPQTFGHVTGVLGALIAWSITGAGMLMLALVFQTLSQRKPTLNAGVYAYARAGFGNYVGFLSALGYWTSACLGNVSFLVLATSTLGALFPALGEGNTPAAVIVASVLLWCVHAMLLRGVRSAATINTIVTVAKIVPIVIFLVVAACAVRADMLTLNFWGADHPSAGDVFGQVRSTMMVTVFVFIGIEGASVYSSYARRRRDVGRATLIGFLSVLCLFSLVTLLSYGILPRAELAGLRNPSVAGVLGAIVGPWGAAFVGVGVLISVLGAFLSWSLLASEVMFQAGRNGTMPRFMAAENKAGAPDIALWMTSGAVQLFLALTLLAKSAFHFAIELTSAMSLVPYLLVAGYALLLAWRGDTYGGERRERRREGMQAALATIFALFLIFAGGAKILMLSAIIYTLGTPLFVAARRSAGGQRFTRWEALLLVMIVTAAAGAIVLLACGQVAI